MLQAKGESYCWSAGPTLIGESVNIKSLSVFYISFSKYSVFAKGSLKSV